MTKWYKEFNINCIQRYFDNLFHPRSVDEYIDYLYSGKYAEESYTSEFRPDENINSNKRPVIFTGCSYTWGDGLAATETISSQFAVLTGRPVYNRAGKGWGLDQFLYQSERDDFYNSVKEEPEYIFYIFIDDHVNRIDKFKTAPFVRDFKPKYKVKNSKLYRQQPNFTDRFYTVEEFQYNYNYIFKKYDKNRIKLYFNEAEKNIHKRWKNVKIVILLFPSCKDDGYYFPELWEELKSENYYNIINIEKLTDEPIYEKQYKVDYAHPSAKVWEIVSPELIKKTEYRLI